MPMVKSLYLHYQGVNGQEIWQAGDLACGASTHNFTTLFDDVVL